MSDLPDTRAAVPFVVGAPRSGTTLVRAMLNSHSTLAIPPESHFLPRLAEAWRRAAPGTTQAATEMFLGFIEREERFRLWDLPVHDVRAEIARASDADTRSLAVLLRALYRSYAVRAGKSRWGEKTPAYALHIPILATLLPEAVFVHVVRDGRDCALAYLTTGIGPTSIAKAAIMWSRHVEDARAAGARLGGGRYIEMRYEDVVSEPAREVGRLCAALGLDFERGMLDYWRDGGSIGGASLQRDAHESVLRPPTPGLRDWRRDLTAGDVRVFEGRAGPTLVACGYALSAAPGFTGHMHRVRHVSRSWVSAVRRRVTRCH